MPDWLLALIVAQGVTVGLALFAKFCPKQKIIGWTIPTTRKAFRALDTLLLSRFGNKAEKIEEGIFMTVIDVLIENCIEAKKILRENNVEVHL
jgi:hypothetical protein